MKEEAPIIGIGSEQDRFDRQVRQFLGYRLDKNYPHRAHLLQELATFYRYLTNDKRRLDTYDLLKRLLGKKEGNLENDIVKAAEDKDQLCQVLLLLPTQSSMGSKKNIFKEALYKKADGTTSPLYKVIYYRRGYREADIKRGTAKKLSDHQAHIPELLVALGDEYAAVATTLSEAIPNKIQPLIAVIKKHLEGAPIMQVPRDVIMLMAKQFLDKESWGALSTTSRHFQRMFFPRTTPALSIPMATPMALPRATPAEAKELAKLAELINHNEFIKVQAKVFFTSRMPIMRPLPFVAEKSPYKVAATLRRKAIYDSMVKKIPNFNPDVARLYYLMQASEMHATEKDARGNLMTAAEHFFRQKIKDQPKNRTLIFQHSPDWYSPLQVAAADLDMNMILSLLRVLVPDQAQATLKEKIKLILDEPSHSVNPTFYRGGPRGRWIDHMKAILDALEPQDQARVYNQLRNVINSKITFTGEALSTCYERYILDFGVRKHSHSSPRRSRRQYPNDYSERESSKYPTYTRSGAAPKLYTLTLAIGWAWRLVPNSIKAKTIFLERETYFVSYLINYTRKFDLRGGENLFTKKFLSGLGVAFSIGSRAMHFLNDRREYRPEVFRIGRMNGRGAKYTKREPGWDDRACTFTRLEQSFSKPHLCPTYYGARKVMKYDHRIFTSRCKVGNVMVRKAVEHLESAVRSQPTNTPCV